MRKISKEELTKILELHEKWLNGEPKGKKAHLSEVDLRGVDLRGANLRGADLIRTNLSGADLSEADFSGADLSETNLSRANLSGTDLSRTDLYGAYLSEANLFKTDLYEANLIKANFSEAYLSEAKINWPMACPETGSFVAWKKVRKNLIVKLEILEDSRRSSATTRKCRCDKARVLAIENIDGTPASVEEIPSKYNENFIYRVGEIVEIPDFDDNRWNECASGIHFFLNREDAVWY